MPSEALMTALLDLDPQVRYVAVAEGQVVASRQRSALADASSADSDRYEELLVNPALVVLARQRGEIDCGGLRYLIVGYGNFVQLVIPHGAGHVSVAIERNADPSPIAERVVGLLGG